MKKDTQHLYQANKNFEKNRDIKIDKIKTTNVNILLNRVRLDEKKQIKRKIILTLFIFCISSLIAVAIL